MLITLLHWPPRRRRNCTGFWSSLSASAPNMAPKPYLSESQWLRIADLFSRSALSNAQGGRPWVPPRECLEGVYGCSSPAPDGKISGSSRIHERRVANCGDAGLIGGFWRPFDQGDRHVHERTLPGVGVRGYKHQAINEQNGGIVIGMRMIHTSVAVTLMAVALADALTPTIVLAMMAVTGLLRPTDQGLRAALIGDTVPPQELAGAVGLSRITSDSARIAGALSGAGLFAALGIGASYAVIATLYAAGVVLISQAENSRTVRAVDDDEARGVAVDRASALRELRDGFIYVWNTPRLAAVIGLALLVNFTAFPISNGLLPFVAREIYGIDQTGLGYLLASAASGAVVGSILMYRAPIGERLARMMIIAGVIWHALLVCFAQVTGFAIGIPILFLVGFAQSLTMVSLTVILVRDAGQRFRGRVMGVRQLVIYSLPIGLLIAGALIETIGFTATATVYASIGIAFTIVIAVRWRAYIWLDERG